jgi:hypothetical protein
MEDPSMVARLKTPAEDRRTVLLSVDHGTVTICPEPDPPSPNISRFWIAVGARLRPLFGNSSTVVQNHKNRIVPQLRELQQKSSSL